MKAALKCPCGELIRGKDEEELLKNVREHLAEKHPGREYTDGEILFMAY